MKVHISILVLSVVLSTSVPVLASQETTPQYQTPESYEQRVKKLGGFLELSLRDAVRLALTNNLAIEIENYNEELNRERIFGTKGFYDPTLTFQLNWNSFEQPNTRSLDAGANILTTIFKRWTFNTSYQQNLVGGTRFEAFFDNDRSTNNDFFATINPRYGSDFGFRFTQPLWKGFRQTQTERQIKLYNLDTEINDSQFKQRVSEIIQQVENQYWELVFSIENFEARRRSLDLAIVQYDDNRKRVDIGVMAPIEITSSRAEVATREQELISSEVQIINAQNAFKRLLSSNPRDSLWNVSLIPTDQPQIRDVTISLDDAIQTALLKRPELEQIRYEVEKLGVDRKFYKKEGKPSIDLVLGLTSIGTAGETFANCSGGRNDPAICENINITPGQSIKVPDPLNPFSGNFGESFGQTFGFDYLNYQVGLSVEIPLRNRSNEAQLAQIAINERQLQSQIRDSQQMIMVDVRNAYEGISTQKKALEAAQVARELSEEQLAGESKRFEAGLSTNFNVLRYQRDLADAQLRELRAMVDYQIALTALQKAMFTIIDESDIVTAKREQ